MQYQEREPRCLSWASGKRSISETLATNSQIRIADPAATIDSKLLNESELNSADNTEPIELSAGLACPRNSIVLLLAGMHPYNVCDRNLRLVTCFSSYQNFTLGLGGCDGHQNAKPN
jgi:hypothetical protein